MGDLNLRFQAQNRRFAFEPRNMGDLADYRAPGRWEIFRLSRPRKMGDLNLRFQAQIRRFAFEPRNMGDLADYRSRNGCRLVPLPARRTSAVTAPEVRRLLCTVGSTADSKYLITGL